MGGRTGQCREEREGMASGTCRRLGADKTVAGSVARCKKRLAGQRLRSNSGTQRFDALLHPERFRAAGETAEIRVDPLAGLL